LTQERFTYALLKDMAKVPFQLDHIFSQTVSGRPKSEVHRCICALCRSFAQTRNEHSTERKAA
jgi:hypothetical protein